MLIYFTIASWVLIAWLYWELAKAHALIEQTMNSITELGRPDHGDAAEICRRHVLPGTTASSSIGDGHGS